MMKKISKIISVILCIAIVLSVFPVSIGNVYAEEDESIGEEFDVTGSANKDYVVKGDFLCIPLKTSKAGVASISFMISGVQTAVHYSYHNCDINAFKQGQGSATAFRYGGNEPNTWGGSADFGAEGPANAVLFISVKDSQKVEGATITVSVKSEFYDIVSEGGVAEANREYKYAQVPGAMFWKINVPSLSRINIEGVELVDGNKKSFPSSVSGTDTAIIQKGTYYLKAINDKTSVRLKTFKYSLTPVKTKVIKNYSKKKATKIKLGKKVSNVVCAYPYAKAHYYKLVLNSDKNISIKYNNELKEMISFEILNEKGKSIAEGDDITKKKGTVKYTDIDRKKFDLVTKSKVKLTKGTYYIKVMPLSGNSFGKYSFVVK